MPRLSNYRPTKTNDYRFFDRTIREMYQVGGVDILVHKYLGPMTNDNDDGNADATVPSYSTSNPLFIEDLLLLENRDRKYDPDVFVMRMVYQESDVDFDLTQFGLFLNGDTKFLTLHYNDMIQVFGRKLMSGDVLEFPNLRDYNPLDTSIQKALPRYYVVQEGSFASEGFSQTWLPHLWRLKCTPMVNAQEYYDILNKPFEPNNIWDSGNFYPEGTTVQDGDTYYRSKQDVPPGTDITDTTYWEVITNPTTIGDKDSARNKDLQINDAILAQARAEVPKSGFDTVKYYIVPTEPDGSPAITGNTANYSVSSDSIIATIGGIKKIPNLQYTVSGSGTSYSITFIPQPSKTGVVQMRYINMSVPGDVESQIITPNGVDTSFTLNHPSTPEGVLVTVNGLALKPTVDYSVVDTTITFRGRPATSNLIEVLYLSVSLPTVIKSEVFVANGNFTVFTLKEPVKTAADILVFENGKLKTPEVDYTVADTSLQFKLTPITKTNIEVRYIANPRINNAPITNQQITISDATATYPVNNVSNSVTPRSDGYTLGYMTGDGIAPNGLPVTPGIAFPLNPAVGDYALRLDYFPNRLFRFNGSAWIKIEENIRTDLYLGEGANTQRSSFVNNSYTVPTSDQGNIPSRQSLSQVLKPVADNGNQGGNKTANPYPGTQPGQPTFPTGP